MANGESEKKIAAKAAAWRRSNGAKERRNGGENKYQHGNNVKSYRGSVAASA